MNRNKGLLFKIWKIGGAAVLAAAVSSISGCGQGSGQRELSQEQKSEEREAPSAENREKPIPIKLADFLAEDHPVNESLNEVLRPMLEEKTDGRYTLEVYSDGDLGGEEDFLKGIRKGTIEAGIAGVELSDQFPALKVVDFPFVFEDIDSSFAALSDPDIMNAMNEAIEPAGIVCKGFVLTGVRSISNDVRPIKTLEDCKGLTLRTPNVTQFIEYAHRLGFETINASVPEIFTVLQQKLADGQENPPTALLTSQWYQVQKYLSLTRHQITYNWIAVNKEFYDSMKEEDRKAFDECCMAYTETVKRAYMKREASDLESLRELGVDVTEVDREPFRAVGQAMIEEYSQKYPEFKGMLEMLREKGAE